MTKPYVHVVYCCIILIMFCDQGLSGSIKPFETFARFMGDEMILHKKLIEKIRHGSSELNQFLTGCIYVGGLCVQKMHHSIMYVYTLKKSLPKLF